MADNLKSRLQSLGLGDLLSQDQENDLPYPLPRKRILRLLEVAATKFTDKATDIMQLHRDILEEKIK